MVQSTAGKLKSPHKKTDKWGDNKCKEAASDDTKSTDGVDDKPLQAKRKMLHKTTESRAIQCLLSPNQVDEQKLQNQ